MNRRKSYPDVSNGLLTFLLLCMIALAGLLIWILIPMLASDSFGPASTYLSKSQVWAYSAQLLLHKNELTTASCENGQVQDFTISLGDSISNIAAKLSASGLIQNSDSFRNYLIYKGLDTNIRAGSYSLSCNIAPLEIAAEIENHYLENVVFDILPGWRSEEIANALATSGIEVSGSDFLAEVNNPSDLQLPDSLSQLKSAEGLLFPGEYTVPRNLSAKELVQMFVTRFGNEVKNAGLSKKNTNGLSFYQTIVLASIIQRESYVDSERPMIASVFYNRLADGIRLETDPTVQYALGYNKKWGWWKSPLSSDDLTIQSEYNTYSIAGLPPAPISNPDISSIRAAENPAQSNYYFFRAKCDNSGEHFFAETLQEQIANACQ